MKEEVRIYGEIPPVEVDTLPGRKMKLSPIVKRSHDTFNSFRIPHLLSPEHKRMMKELPY